MTTTEQNNRTEITLTAGDKTIPAVLNNSRAARELISRLPYTVDLHRYDHDYCGVMDAPLAYDKQVGMSPPVYKS